MKKKIILVLGNVLIFLILLAVLELLTRIFVPEINLSGLDKRMLKDNVYYSSRGFVPNATGINYGFTFRTDNTGFCKYAHNHKGAKKILYLGDSVTMGIGVDEDSTFAGIINNNSDTVVLNPALIGYARQDYLNIIKKLIVEQKNGLQVSGVCLFWCLNDVYNFYPESTTPEIKPKGIFGAVLGFVKNNFKLFYFIKNTFTDRAKSYYLYDEQFYSPDNKLFNESISDLDQISGILKNAGIPFEVFLLPYEYQIREGIKKPQKLFKDSLLVRNIAVNDLIPVFAKQNNSKELFLYGDGIHLSNKGHRLVAEYLRRLE
jgi:hypothetical protein